MPERAIPAATSGAQARRTRATDAVRRQARRFAFGTVLVLLALLASDAAHATPEACQSAIERVGHRYARRVLRQVTECSAAERMEPISTCLAAPAAAKARTRLRTRWSKATATVCADTDFASDLGYLGTCAAAPSSCTFATPVLDALGPRNDVLDCLACRIEETLDAVGAKLLANQPVRHACHETIGRRGVKLLRRVLVELHRCPARKDKSIAACFGQPGVAKRLAKLLDRRLAAWRAASVAACTTSPIDSAPHYPTLCAGIEPTVLPACAFQAAPCTFGATQLLDAPGANNDDLLDCLSCQLQDAALTVARELYGANVCCVGDDCGLLRTRRACQRAGGEPAYYGVATIPQSIFSPHALGMAADGTVYVAATGDHKILTISPQGQTSPFVNYGAPYDVSVDPATGEVYAADRCSHRVLRLNANGQFTTIAGTGAQGHSGDGGPATAAKLMAPNKSAVDAEGNVYVTESALLSFLCGAPPQASERVRKIDRNGIITTVAGGNAFGVGGPAVEATLGIPSSVEVAPDGTVLIGESGMHRVLRIEHDQTLSHVAGLSMGIVGAYAGDGGLATRARIHSACGVAQGDDGQVFIGDMNNNRIRLVDREGSIISIAGTGLAGQTLGADGQPGLLADAGCPEDVAVAPDGRVYFASLTSSRVRVLTLVRY